MDGKSRVGWLSEGREGPAESRGEPGWSGLGRTSGECGQTWPVSELVCTVCVQPVGV